MWKTSDVAIHLNPSKRNDREVIAIIEQLGVMPSEEVAQAQRQQDLENPPTLRIDWKLARVSRWRDEPRDQKTVRRREIRNLFERGLKRSIYVWNGVIIDGIETYRVGLRLGKVAGRDYPIVRLEVEDESDAKLLRYELNVSAQKQMPALIRCFQALRLYGECKRWREQSRQNRINALKGKKAKKPVDRLMFLAQKAGVSRATMGRVDYIFKEMMRNPDDPDPKKRPVVSNSDIEEIIDAVLRKDVGISTASQDVKNERERKRRSDKNKSNAPMASASFRAQTEYDPSATSQVVCGNSLTLMQQWASLPDALRPCPSLIVGSPPYWIPAKQPDNLHKGRIVYGEKVQEFFTSLNIDTWQDYVEKFLSAYLEAALAILPEGGRFVWNVDNTRGVDQNRNKIVYWHTNKLIELGESMGYIATPLIHWHKNEIAGRRQGFGSRNSPNIRPNEEYLVVLRKGHNRIEGDFDGPSSAFYDWTVNGWELPSTDDMSPKERDLFSNAIWQTNTARCKDHPAVYPMEIPYRVIRLFAPKDSVVMDPWNGVGTTCAAAVMAGRRYLGIDIEPAHCEHAQEKIQRAIKQQAAAETEAKKRVHELAGFAA